MGEETATQVIGKDFRGTLIDSLPSVRSDTVRILLDTGSVIAIPSSMLHGNAPGIYRISIGAADLEQFQEPGTPAVEQVIVPVLAEELHITKQVHATGGVRVHRRTEEHDETIEIPLVKQAAHVRRVLIEREVDGPIPVRDEGDTTIISIVEEVPIVAKRFVLKEEIHITRTTREELHQERVTVRRQEAEVERIDGSGRPVSVQSDVSEDDQPYTPNRKDHTQR